MTDEEIQAVATTLGMLLDELQTRGEDRVNYLRSALEGIGDLLGEAGGLAVMAQVFDAVMDQKPDAESWREGVLDARWSGFGGWGS